MQIAIDTLGISTVVNEFSIEKSIEDNLFIAEIDADVNFFGDNYKVLRDQTFAGRGTEDADLKFMCDETEVIQKGYIQHNEGKFDHRMCKFNKKLYLKKYTECLKTKEGNIFDSTASVVKTLQGDYEKYIVGKTGYLNLGPDEVPTLDQCIDACGGIDAPQEGYFITYIDCSQIINTEIDPDPQIGQYYTGHTVNIAIYFVRIKSTTQFNQDWAPLSSGGFYYSKYPESKWTTLDGNSQTIGTGVGSGTYFTQNFTYGRINAIVDRNISNAINFNEVIEDMFSCSGKTVVSNFFGINADSTNPSNEVYDFSNEFYQDLKILQSYDIIREDANRDSYGKSGKYNAKKLLKDLCTYFNMVAIYDSIEDVMRFEHVSYFQSKGLDLVAQNVPHHVSDEMDVNKEQISIETWRMAAITPSSYESKIVYNTADVTGIEKEYPLEYLISDYINLLNNKDFEKEEYYKKFFIVSTIENKIINFNAALDLKTVITKLHYQDRPSIIGVHDGESITLNGYSLGITANCEIDSSMVTFQKINPYNSLVTDQGTFLIESLSITNTGKITFKLRK